MNSDVLDVVFTSIIGRMYRLTASLLFQPICCSPFQMARQVSTIIMYVSNKISVVLLDSYEI